VRNPEFQTNTDVTKYVKKFAVNFDAMIVEVLCEIRWLQRLEPTLEMPEIAKKLAFFGNVLKENFDKMKVSVILCLGLFVFFSYSTRKLLLMLLL
jgi:hypothetical protein